MADSSLRSLQMFQQTGQKISMCIYIYILTHPYAQKCPYSYTCIKTHTYRVLHRIGSFFFSNRYFWRKNVIVRVKRLSLEEFYKKCHDVVMWVFFLLSL